MAWEKIKEFVSRIFKELLQLNKKTKVKMGEELEKTVFQRYKSKRKPQ
jgi:hypothetical protein